VLSLAEARDMVNEMFAKNREKIVIDPLETALPKSWMHFNGMDHGYNNPTCWLWAAVDPDGRIIVFDEHYASGMIVREHAKVVHARNAFWGRIPRYNVGDPSIRNKDPLTGTSVHIEYAECGIPIILGNNDQKAGIQRVARYLT